MRINKFTIKTKNKSSCIRSQKKCLNIFFSKWEVLRIFFLFNFFVLRICKQLFFHYLNNEIKNKRKKYPKLITSATTPTRFKENSWQPHKMYKIKKNN